MNGDIEKAENDNVARALFPPRDDVEKASDIGEAHHLRTISEAVGDAFGQPDDIQSLTPPSFAQSEFQTIVRRQRCGNDPDGLKIGHAHPKSPHLGNDWEFAGWGSMRYVEITKADMEAAEERLKTPQTLLGTIKASSVAGNGVVGSVFYTFPVIAATAAIYSPLCLVVACLLLLFFRPIMLELAAAVRLNGANYIYLLQFAGKTASIIGAAATLLDSVATSTVSAATASTYLAGEINHLPISTGIITILILCAFALLALAGLRESAVMSATVFLFHLLSMSVLIVAGIVHWAHSDPHSLILRDNWDLRPSGALETVRVLFYGICVAFLGVTGFECTPSYIVNMRPATYSAVLRNLICIAAFLNGMLCLLVFAIIPQETILGGANVLSVLAEYAAGRWLRYWIVVDAISVLLGGVLTGVVSAGSLIDRLAQDHVLPRFFLAKLPLTGSAYNATLASLALSLLLFVASGMSLNNVSLTFSIAFLFVLFLFAVSNLLLKLNRPHLPREPRVGILTLFGAIVVVVTTWAGNVALTPTSLALFAASFAIILLVLLILNAQPKILHLSLRLFGASTFAHNRCPGLGRLLMRWYKRSRSAQVCVWMKTDDIHIMLEALLSVARNAPDARNVVFVHAYPNIKHIPTELHPNTRLLDEAFPTITVDLAFVQGTFGPTLVEATSRILDIPRTRMCVVHLGRDHPWSLGDYRGVRVLT